MKKILYFILLFIINLNCSQIFSQSYDINQSEKVGDAVSNISASIISDSLVPATHYEKGEYRISLVPAYFDIDIAYNDPEIKGNDLTGWSVGLGGGYALTDRLLAYGILAHMEIDGDASGKIYGEELPKQKSSVDYKYTAFCTGVGFDLFNNSNWSIPLYAGGIFQHYSSEFVFDEVDDGLYSYEAEFSSDSFLFGITLSAAVSYKIKEMFLITPYILYMQNINESEGDVKITGHVGVVPYSQNETFEVDKISAIMPGLCFTFISKKKISVSLSTGGYIASSSSKYNDIFLDGLKMKSVVLVLTYRGEK